jgi:hypothetical protein
MRRMAVKVLAGAALFVVASSTLAGASWPALSAPPGTGAAVATTIPAGEQPAVTGKGLDVQVSWEATTLSGGTPVDGYTVSAYNTSTGEPRTPGGTCAPLVAVTSCLDEAPPPGSWTYIVAPRHLGWAGPESLASDPVVIDK